MNFVRKPDQRAGQWQVNWGSSFPGGRGTVEYINLKLPRPTDVTLYLGAPKPGNMWFSPNFVISVGSGGTTFDYVVGEDPNYGGIAGVAGSGRGVALHFVADELIVRGDTAAVPPITQALAQTLRYSAQCGLGRPSTFERMNPFEGQANGGAEIGFPLTPWSTHARVMVGWDPATMNAIDGFQVRQICTNPFGTTVVVENMPISNYLQPFPLHPYATGLIVTTTGGGGPPPAGPGPGAVYFVYMAETVVY